MDCYCSSKTLYANENNQSIIINKEKIPACRESPKLIEDSLMKQQMLELSSIYLPTFIQKISYYEMLDNPLWFYKQFIGSNKPCIITQALEGIDLIENWKNPKDFISHMKQLDINKISTSITPDGFADSIKNQYFIEPHEIQTDMNNIIKWKEGEQSQIKSEWIPYIQHQNSNLTQELSPLHGAIKHESKKFLSQAFFKNEQPDAQNFWMGYNQSVSSIHKDPYQNFYSVLVGEKHFSLLPPISILYLPEYEYINSKWKCIDGSLQIEANNLVNKTRWICCNPDLEKDIQRFPLLENIKDYNLHVTVEAGEMLYLPSLWYHQVSQHHNKDPYVIAMNYWFDMDIKHSHTLYETARKLCGYS